MTSKDEQIEINLSEIDFKRIHTVMIALGWTWKDTESGESRTPTIEEISVMARYCMEEAWNSENKIFNMGGFESEVIEGTIGIKFVVESVNPLSKLF